MISRLAVKRQLLYDGAEQDMPSQFVLDINSESLTVTKGEVSGKSLRKLKDSVSAKDFDTIASGLKFEKFGDIDLYTVDGAQVYYVLKDDTILIFSFTEFQPDRYKIFLESAWKR